MHDVKRSSLRRRLRPLAGANVLKYCFLLPAVVWIVAFSIFPLLSAFHYSFANYVLGRGITGYVGFANYINVLSSGTFWYSLFITVVYVSIAVPWLTTTSGGLAAAIMLDIWRWTPFVFLISLAGLSAIPDEMYEAALPESSDYWQLMVHIAVPLSWPVVSVALLLRLIEGFKSFGLPLALTGGGPATSTQLFSMLNYFTTIQFFDFGTGSAMAVLYLCFVSAVVALFFRLLRKRFD
jgi:multiple sugar transport system permease protein